MVVLVLIFYNDSVERYYLAALLNWGSSSEPCILEIDLSGCLLSSPKDGTYLVWTNLDAQEGMHSSQRGDDLGHSSFILSWNPC